MKFQVPVRWRSWRRWCRGRSPQMGIIGILYSQPPSLPTTNNPNAFTFSLLLWLLLSALSNQLIEIEHYLAQFISRNFDPSLQALVQSQTSSVQASPFCQTINTFHSMIYTSRYRMNKHMMNMIRYATWIRTKSMSIIIQLSLQGEDSEVIGENMVPSGKWGDSGLSCLGIWRRGKIKAPHVVAAER